MRVARAKPLTTHNKTPANHLTGASVMVGHTGFEPDEFQAIAEELVQLFIWLRGDWRYSTYPSALSSPISSSVS